MSQFLQISIHSKKQALAGRLAYGSMRRPLIEAPAALVRTAAMWYDNPADGSNGRRRSIGAARRHRQPYPENITALLNGGRFEHQGNCQSSRCFRRHDIARAESPGAGAPGNARARACDHAGEQLYAELVCARPELWADEHHRPVGAEHREPPVPQADFRHRNDCQKQELCRHPLPYGEQSGTRTGISAHGEIPQHRRRYPCFLCVGAAAARGAPVAAYAGGACGKNRNARL